VREPSGSVPAGKTSTERHGMPALYPGDFDDDHDHKDEKDHRD
jgi:hypothetical protein